MGNPQYVELSDRAIQNWIAKSGMRKQHQGGKWHSNDKPEYNFGLSMVDDHSIRKAIMSIAPLVPRHYIVMEVKENLVADDRKANLQRFNMPHFKKIAKVMMGEPASEYKEKVYAQMLVDKQNKSDREFKQAKIEKQRKKQIAKRQKELKKKQEAAAAEAKKKREEAEAKRKAILEAAAKKRAEAAEKKKAEEEAKKAAEAGEKKEEDKKDGEAAEEKKDDTKEGENASEEKKEEKKEGDTAEDKKDGEEKKEEAKDETKEEPKEE